ncbi:MAG: hypothetical protein WCA10_03125 [Terracidiphilus sp.]
MPTKNSDQRLTLYKAIQKLWVAGTMGAFFTAFARNLPGHLREFSLHPNWAYSIDLFVRYLYLSWFLMYFFISNLENENAKTVRGKDVSFDVLQSGGALVGAYMLGFVVPTVSFTVQAAYLFTNAAILVICLFSLILFRKDPDRSHTNLLRSLGCVASGIGVGLAVVVFLSTGLQTVSAVLGFGVVALFLWILLIAFSCGRLTKPIGFWIIGDDTKVGAPDTGKGVDISTVPYKRWKLVLDIAETIPGKAVAVTVQSSGDGIKWESNPGCQFPTKSGVGTTPAELDLSLKGCQQVRFLRATWNIEELPERQESTGAGPLSTKFTLRLKAEEMQTTIGIGT